MLRLEAFAYSGPRWTVWFHRASGVSVKARVSDICELANASVYIYIYRSSQAGGIIYHLFVVGFMAVQSPNTYQQISVAMMP